MTNALETARAARAANPALWNRLLVDLPRRFFQRLARRGRMRRDEAFLLRQPDHILRDIGIGRSEIHTAMRRGARWDRPSGS